MIFEAAIANVKELLSYYLHIFQKNAVSYYTQFQNSGAPKIAGPGAVAPPPPAPPLVAPLQPRTY